MTLVIRARAAVRGVGADGVPEVMEDAAIAVRDGLIAEIGPAGDVLARHEDAEVAGGDDVVAVPGLVNAHHHSGLTPTMLGMPHAPLELWLPRFRGVRGVGLRLDTLYSAIEMLETGTTTVQHIQGELGAEDTWDESVDAVADAYREMGMRVSWSVMLRDRNQLTYDDDAAVLASLPVEVAEHFAPQLAVGLAPPERHIAFFERASVRWRERDGDHVALQLAPANLHWCSDGLLEALFDAARRHGAKVHMHLLETERQAAFAAARYGRSAVAHLAALGCLGPHLTLGHGIWVSAGDLDLLAEHRCSVCHNASSGLRLGSGVAPVTEMQGRGIPVALGIDQANLDDDRDLWAEMRLAFALHRPSAMFGRPPTAAEVFRMATEHAAATTPFEGRIGRLDPGRAADIVTIDWARVARPHVEPGTALLDALVVRSRKDMVRDVWVGGEKVVADGRVTRIDRDAVLAEIAARLARAPTPEEARAASMTARLAEHLERWFRADPLAASGRPYRYNVFGDLP